MTGSVEDVYRRRLAEFSGPVPSQTTAYAPTPGATPAAAPTPAATPRMDVAANDAIKLVPPGEARRSAALGSGGAKPLDALDLGKVTASFQVAELSFGEGTAALSPGADAQLRDIVAAYRKSGPTANVAIFARSASPRLDVSASANSDANLALANERADVVARELERLGVPASHIYAGPAQNAFAGDQTDVYVDM